MEMSNQPAEWMNSELTEYIFYLFNSDWFFLKITGKNTPEGINR